MSYRGFRRTRRGAYYRPRPKSRFWPRVYKGVKLAGSVASTASKALMVANQVRSLINVEFKYHEGSIAASVSTTPSIMYLTQIARGDGPSERQGDSIKVKSMIFKYTLAGNTSAEQTFVRCIIGIDRDYRGSSVTAAGGTTDSLLLVQSMVSPSDIHNTNRFKVLYDKVHSFSNEGPETYFKKYFKKFSLESGYNGSASTAYKKNQLFCMFFSDQATNTPVLSMRYRVRYVDN